MLNIINIELFPISGFKLKPSVIGIGSVGRGAKQVPTGPPVDLVVPWQKEIQKYPVLFSLLGWHCALSEFRGYDVQMAKLTEWAMDDRPVSIKFITGEGGAGKSRLAAEFATKLKDRNWAAGFVNLQKPQSFALEKEGTLLLVDYPEENKNEVAELFRDLSGIEPVGRIRVLLLTRQRIEDWLETISDSKALGLVDTIPVNLVRFDDPNAYDIFSSAQENTANIYQTEPLPISKGALTDWLTRAPENERPLFLVALGVHSALYPDEEVVQYKGREVIEALVERELARLRRTAENLGFTDHYTLARIVAMAAISDSIYVSLISEIAKQTDLKLGFPAGADIEILLRDVGLLEQRIVLTPKPDILAAAFAVKVFGQKPEIAPELLWDVLSLDIGTGFEVLGRLSHDAEIVLGLHKYRISKWLVNAVYGNPRRCHALQNFISDRYVPLG